MVWIRGVGLPGLEMLLKRFGGGWRLVVVGGSWTCGVVTRLAEVRRPSMESTMTKAAIGFCTAASCCSLRVSHTANTRP